MSPLNISGMDNSMMGARKAVPERQVKASGSQAGRVPPLPLRG
jgi:hypothetical protein